MYDCDPVDLNTFDPFQSSALVILIMNAYLVLAVADESLFQLGSQSFDASPADLELLHFLV